MLYCIEHIQYISTLVQAKPEHYRSKFGVQFMLDVIRIYYSSMGHMSTVYMGTGTLSCHTHSESTLNEEEYQQMRSALYNIIKLYIMKDVTKEEVEAILNFLASCHDSIVVSF